MLGLGVMKLAGSQIAITVCMCVCSTVLHLIKRLLEYSSYAETLPMLINDIMTKLIDIIKVWLLESRTRAISLRDFTTSSRSVFLCLSVCLSVCPVLQHADQGSGAGRWGHECC